MPLLYTGRCETCGERFCAAEVDWAIQLDDGQIIHLCHPGETRELEEMGLTWQQASDEARLIRCINLLCKSCGGLYEARSFSGPVGCLAGCFAFLACLSLFAVVVSLIIIAVERPNQWFHSVIYAGAAVLTSALAYATYRHRRRTFDANLTRRPPLDDVRCCQATTHDSRVLVSDAVDKGPFICSQCGRLSVTVDDFCMS